jgi:hypothetical protein
MRFLLGLIGWAVLITGALPKPGQLGLFLALEGTVRFVIATQGAASASLALIAIWRVASAVLRRRDQPKSRVTGPR